MKRTSKNYLLLSVLFLLAALGVWAYFIFFIHGLDISANTFQAEAAQAYAKKNQLASEENIVKETATTTDILYGAFASSSDIVDVVEAIEGEGTAHSVSAKVRSITTASSSDPALLSLDMDIDATGSWADLVAFSGSIERLPYAMALTKASFFNSGSGKNGWSFSGHITSFLSP